MPRIPRILLLAIQVNLVVGLAVAIRSRTMPLGVRGEWEWLRITTAPSLGFVVIAVGSVTLYALYVAAALSRIQQGKSARSWLVGLVPMAVLAQVGLQVGAPSGYGLAKWALALTSPGSSGYYTVAKRHMRDLPTFLIRYPAWIKEQDALHVGTHPPGLFVVSWTVLRVMEADPKLARGAARLFPPSLDLAFRSVSPERPLPDADRAALTMMGALVLLCCSATALPLYALAHSRLSPSASWVAASLWPVVPAAILFQPTADTAFPLLATSAIALAAWSRRSWGLAILAGIVLGLGTSFTLAFFPVGLIVACIIIVEPNHEWRRKSILVMLIGAGFLGLTMAVWALTQANPFAIWRANAANHARFYNEYHRSYWPWVVENPIELAIAIGVPTLVWIATGLHSAPKVAWATVGVLILLTLTGKNLSEVARLWLPLMPPLLLFAGQGFERRSSRPIDLAATIGLLGAQTLVLEATIQVVYPI